MLTPSVSSTSGLKICFKLTQTYELLLVKKMKVILKNTKFFLDIMEHKGLISIFTSLYLFSYSGLYQQKPKVAASFNLLIFLIIFKKSLTASFTTFYKPWWEKVPGTAMDEETDQDSEVLGASA